MPVSGALRPRSVSSCSPDHSHTYQGRYTLTWSFYNGVLDFTIRSASLALQPTLLVHCPRAGNFRSILAWHQIRGFTASAFWMPAFGYLGAWFYTPNGAFFSIPVLEPQTEERLGSVESHLSYEFSKLRFWRSLRFWTSLDANFWFGGATSLNRKPNPATEQRSSHLQEKLPSSETIRLHEAATRFGIGLILLAIAGTVFSAVSHWFSRRRLKRGRSTGPHPMVIKHHPRHAARSSRPCRAVVIVCALS